MEKILNKIEKSRLLYQNLFYTESIGDNKNQINNKIIDRLSNF